MQLSLFQNSRWEILQTLSQGPKSTSELASILRTSAPNISQQLRQLELAGLIERTKTPDKTSHYVHGIKQSLTTTVSIGPALATANTHQGPDITHFMISALAHTPHHGVIEALINNPKFVQTADAIALLDTQQPELLVFSQQVEKIRTDYSNIKVQYPHNHSVIVWSHNIEEFNTGLYQKQDYFTTKLNQIHLTHDPEGIIAALLARNTQKHE